MSDARPLNVLIVGGGAAALEAAFGLQRLAVDRVDVTILSPDEHFATHAFAVLVPFAAGHTPQEPLARIASDAGARLRHGRMASVDVAGHQVMTSDGEAIDYDVLLVAIGAVKRDPYAHVLTFGRPGSEERMHGLIQDLEDGYLHRIAFVVPSDASWPMPLYELALMSAERAYDVSAHCDLMVLTAEDAPLALFGREASRVLERRLADAGVALITGVDVDVVKQGLITLHPGGEQVRVERVVTLPTLVGPAVEGLPADAHGFVPVDRHGRVQGAADVYAAGDATHFPIKQGGLACQQADAAAESIAARAGSAIEPRPYSAMLQGLLLTERDATVMRRDAGGAGEDERTPSAQPVWWPPSKVAGRELAQHIGGLPRHAIPADIEGVEIRQPLVGA
jgi:sulfide:quinone oxidoreductase